MRLPTLEQLLHVAGRTLDVVEVRAPGLLESALARPAMTAFGDDVYPTLHEKAAALVHSVARKHALIDGNKRLALMALVTTLGLHGERLTLDNDGAYDLIYAIASGDLDEVGDIAARLDVATEPWTFGEH